MISVYLAKVSKIVSQREGITVVEVESEGEKVLALNYDDVTGKIEVGDKVYVNRTARLLNLGTGGYDFIVVNLKYPKYDAIGNGHIMKLRYTPFQINVLAMEEQNNPYHTAFEEFESLEDLPVIVGELHSMVAPVALVLKSTNPNLKITYVMTDGGCLPISFSNTVFELKKRGIIDKTVTIGHAFGGDYECVNIYTALIGAKEVLKADVVIVAMGPGIIGTGTKYGFSGVEQAHIIDATNKLGGKPVLIPRIGFNDKRQRHQGISHHTITVLELCNSSCVLTFPTMEEEKEKIIKEQINSNPVFSRYKIEFIEAEIIRKYIEESGLNLSTMGRNYESEPDFFNACGAAALYVSSKLVRN
ncbi:Protein of unknown function [Thermoanaerobacter uzonensis DSM 18761]|uniref:DUF3866 domain-containing protein n=1 Tax=Thermoanaerobacter uzonensis DSM 18761 TaxID=1123369 RepID=A0A1M4V5X0_9THEO|nr:DUF3866 family protein [Thermoanaerobacter uzonensis]SHE64268.1 Protein of unknown function [Thermoanaerobacter uzonensis DSM 18761]